ncbi:uncharacterized protein JN550_000740 [Neoarthrinium moseri]|uniref:uncharacterized protein n=1 Tax=Neoarthrinium moseri TaxID=1658444 RepID=UPI001FDB6BB4|nr:uncharacterized protein JN550_000740 [Neoarthrinium moseri]KAI1878558.1 hypothetical protein JN550_000740 [Neoarthrinium moseri]
MGLARQGSVKVANVNVPQRLLSTRRNPNATRWQPRDEGQEVIAQNGPVQDAIREERRLSLVYDEPRGRRPSLGAANGGYGHRRLSDPVTKRETSSLRSSRLTTLEDIEASRPTSRGDTTSQAFPTLDESLHTFRFDHDGSSYNHWEKSGRSSAQSTTWSEAPETRPQRSGTVKAMVQKVIPDAVLQRGRSVAQRVRRSSIHEVYEKAKLRGKELERKPWAQTLFEITFYTLLLCFIYFVLIGVPLWNGAVWWLYYAVQTKFVLQGGWAITIGIAVFYAFGPLLCLFEDEPPQVGERPADFDRTTIPGVHNTALLVPCYKSENIIGPTLEAALKIFPPSHIFVIANGNSETPLDDTEGVCRKYGVQHVWSSVGSKIVAQYVGCYKAKRFENVLLIDDDCALPPNFPIVSEQLTGKVKSIGYTIKSVGPNSSKGTWCQQAQDLEYKLSGLQRLLAGKMGSATFPHGAISLWNRKFLISIFNDHPGYSVSEDWFFGDSCRRLGGRITMCSAVFVETETPDAIFFSSGGSRGGFGEMTVFKQRFMRWNFFFVNGIYYNMKYIIKSWRLGWWEFGAKLFVFQEVYETLLYLFTPFVLPISFYVRPDFCGYMLLATIGMYLLNTLIFNEVHLRRRNERISWTVVLVYYMPYKLILTLVNVASCYWSLYKYAKYFAKRHPKIIEDEKAVEVAMRIDEETYIDEKGDRAHLTKSFTTASSRSSDYDQDTKATELGHMRPNRLSFIAGEVDSIPPSPTWPQPTYSPSPYSPQTFPGQAYPVQPQSAPLGVHSTDFGASPNLQRSNTRRSYDRVLSYYIVEREDGRKKDSWAESPV